MDSLNLFQIIGLGVLLLLAFSTAIAVASHRLPLKTGLAWTTLWVGAAILVAFPDLTGRIARVLGIGRGVDIVLYFAIMAGAVGFFLIYIRFRRLESHISALVQEIALQSKRQERADAADEER